jgi:hypothetical protein
VEDRQEEDPFQGSSGLRPPGAQNSLDCLSRACPLPYLLELFKLCVVSGIKGGTQTEGV